VEGKVQAENGLPRRFSVPPTRCFQNRQGRSVLVFVESWSPGQLGAARNPSQRLHRVAPDNPSPARHSFLTLYSSLFLTIVIAGHRQMRCAMRAISTAASCSETTHRVPGAFFHVCEIPPRFPSTKKPFQFRTSRKTASIVLLASSPPGRARTRATQPHGALDASLSLWSNKPIA
jgi:hypothetical protein